MWTGFVRVVFGAQLLLVSTVSNVWAVSCVSPPLSAEAIEQFKANPQTMVAPESDTSNVETLARNLAGTDATLAADIIRVAEATTPRFRLAIAAGLAQAATACSTADHNAAQLIQQAVAAFRDGEFQSAFAAVTEDLSGAAADVTLASAAASAGSVAVTNPNGSRDVSTNSGSKGVAVVFQIAPSTLQMSDTTVTVPNPRLGRHRRLSQEASGAATNPVFFQIAPSTLQVSDPMVTAASPVSATR